MRVSGAEGENLQIDCLWSTEPYVALNLVTHEIMTEPKPRQTFN